jgi:photosystem II stability/assembly factor-like uncharacterized protein
MSGSQNLRLYAATHDGVFALRLENGRCQPVAEALRGAIVDCVEPCPATEGSAFAGDTHGGLYRTDDSGLHWRKLFEGNVRAIKVDPTDDRVVYVGTEPVRLFRSEDRGEHWEEIASLQRLPEDTRRKLGKPPETDTDFANPRFRHGRQEWTFPIAPHVGHITEIFIRPDDPREIWLSIEHGGIARSLDRGATWEDASAGIDYLDIHKLIRLPGRDDRYLVSSARGLYASPDPVAGWARAEHGMERNYFHEMLTLERPDAEDAPVLVCTAEHSPARWPATMGDGKWAKGAKGARTALYRSDDRARSWRRIGVGAGLPDEMDPMIWSLRRHPDDRDGVFAGVGEVARGYAFGTAGSGQILQSDDQGASWRVVASDLPAVRQLAVVRG